MKRRAGLSLKRIKPGYVNPPAGCPVYVPGINWFLIMVTGLTGNPALAHWCWWTIGGEVIGKKVEVDLELLKRLT